MVNVQNPDDNHDFNPEIEQMIEDRLFEQPFEREILEREEVV